MPRSGGKRDLHADSVSAPPTKKSKTGEPSARSEGTVNVLLVGEGNFSYSKFLLTCELSGQTCRIVYFPCQWRYLFPLVFLACQAIALRCRGNV